MPTIKPFAAVRPAPGMAARVAALPYDVVDSREAREIVAQNPYSFLRVDRAEVDLEPSIDVHDPRVYQKVRENLNRMLADGVFSQDGEENFYIYRLTMGDHHQVGLVACTAVDDYLNNTIKRHEQTRPDKEKDRVQHIEACNAHTGPIFLTYRARGEIDVLISRWTQNHPPVYDFLGPGGIGHTVWVVDDRIAKEELAAAFGAVKGFYIADGHHRCAAAARVALRRREQDADYTGEEEYNYFPAVLFPHTQLKILDYNRVVRDLNGLTPVRFKERVKEKFVLEDWRGQGPYRPEKRGLFGMYLEGKWYVLRVREEVLKGRDIVASLDVSLLQDNILGPILGIKDPRTDARIDFIGGSRGLKELEDRVRAGMAVAFSLYPTTITDVMDIADRNMVLPPKSTWFEPKLLSGLFIHPLE
ncbi:MAG TPA: DUF1015 domain-containing protein [Firmicutes bacterium]|nr:DUF1015 domain-containing protein [Bacillota bacterium]